MFNEVLSYLILTDLPQLGMPKSYRDFWSQAAEFGIIWDVFHGGPMDLAVPGRVGTSPGEGTLLSIGVDGPKPGQHSASHDLCGTTRGPGD